MILLAFLYNYGNGNNIPSGVIGQSCSINTSGEGQNCEAVASSIATCQKAGVKVIFSLGGAMGAYSLQSRPHAEQIGQFLWDAYGNSGNHTVQWPFRDVFVDGFDFDLEVNEGSQYYPCLISKIRSNFASDHSHSYFITGPPQCPLPEPNMEVIIANYTFDYLWVQFYNNPTCPLGLGENAPFNYDDWAAFIATTQCSKAKLFVRVPAAPLASNRYVTSEEYYATPDQLASIVSDLKNSTQFGGVCGVPHFLI